MNRVRVLLMEKVLEWVSKVNSAGRSYGLTIIVEGPGDARSLRSLGVTTEILTVRDIRAEILESPGEIPGRAFGILVDFDREGSRLYLALKRDIEELGGVVEDWPRRSYRRAGLPKRVEEAEVFLRRRGLLGGL